MLLARRCWLLWYWVQQWWWWWHLQTSEKVWNIFEYFTTLIRKHIWFFNAQVFPFKNQAMFNRTCERAMVRFMGQSELWIMCCMAEFWRLCDRGLISHSFNLGRRCVLLAISLDCAVISARNLKCRSDCAYSITECSHMPFHSGTLQ